MKEKKLLKKIAETSEVIRKKYRALKSDRVMLEDSLSKTFKPIVEPLRKLTEHNEAIFVAPKHEIKQEPIKRSLSREESLIILMKRRKSYLTSTPQRKDFIRSSRINEYYPGTKGLFELIFMKEPEDYTKYDLGTYKSILSQTNVHREDNTSTGNLRGNKGHKWKEIISTLFPSKAKLVQGNGYMRVTNNPVSYVDWNDPNELVERLKLLIASSAAGHTNHHNEIQSMIEVLHEEAFYFTMTINKFGAGFNTGTTSAVNISVLMSNFTPLRDSFTKEMNEYSLKLNECVSKCEILEEKITALLKKHTDEIEEKIEKLNHKIKQNIRKLPGSK
ncbi:uncharacterized protein [Prorops nasuta]|uniref:uncharacterized protein n=1 Tax=Prorops nasuta TaxID=863751 RepID=UPI0034CFFA39